MTSVILSLMDVCGQNAESVGAFICAFTVKQGINQALLLIVKISYLFQKPALKPIIKTNMWGI